MFIYRLWNNVYDRSVNHEQFHSYANDTEKDAQQMAAIPLRGRFLTETPLERERWLEIQREQRRRRRQHETRSRENIA